MRRTRLDYISRKWLGWALFLYTLKTLVFSHVFASELPKCPPDGPYHNCFGTYIWVSGHKKGDKYIGEFRNIKFMGPGLIILHPIQNLFFLGMCIQDNGKMEQNTD